MNIAKRMQTLLDSLISEGKERGLQVAAYVDGKLVVNAWAGISNGISGQAVAEDTLFPVFSTTKGMTATIIHLLVERGQISYEDRISKVWPEFGAHGKESITLRQALNHTCGIPQMPRGIGFVELCDWEVMCRKIADLTPLWEPGTRMEYHAMTFGWILGEVARRVDGRSFTQLVADEICRPLGMEAMYVGAPDELEPRVAFLEDNGGEEPPPDDGKPQAIPVWLMPLHVLMNRPDARRACIPATNGVMSALAIARHYAALLPEGVDGIRLLPPPRVKIATEMQKPDHPENEDYSKSRALGYAIGEEGSLYGDASAFGHGGYGGSQGFAEPRLGLAVGLTKNRFGKEDNVRLIIEELRSSLQVEFEGRTQS